MTDSFERGTAFGDVDRHIAPQLSRSALVVIDTQVDFLDSGSSPIPGTSQVLPAITRLLGAYRAAGLPVVHVVRLYDGEDVDLPRRTLIESGSPIVRPGTPGSQIAPVLRPDRSPDLDPQLLLAGGLQQLGPQEVALWKPRWGAFYRTPLDEHLRAQQVNTVTLAGCNYPNCPRAAAYGASERDYRVLIVSDAISGVQALHLEEAGRMGVLHASTGVVVEAVGALTPIAAPS